MTQRHSKCLLNCHQACQISPILLPNWIERHTRIYWMRTFKYANSSSNAFDIFLQIRNDVLRIHNWMKLPPILCTYMHENLHDFDLNKCVMFKYKTKYDGTGFGMNYSIANMNILHIWSALHLPKMFSHYDYRSLYSKVHHIIYVLIHVDII